MCRRLSPLNMIGSYGAHASVNSASNTKMLVPGSISEGGKNGSLVTPLWSGGGVGGAGETHIGQTSPRITSSFCAEFSQPRSDPTHLSHPGPWLPFRGVFTAVLDAEGGTGRTEGGEELTDPAFGKPEQLV